MDSRRGYRSTLKRGNEARECSAKNKIMREVGGDSEQGKERGEKVRALLRLWQNCLCVVTGKEKDTALQEEEKAEGPQKGENGKTFALFIRRTVLSLDAHSRRKKIAWNWKGGRGIWGGGGAHPANSGGGKRVFFPRTCAKRKGFFSGGGEERAKTTTESIGKKVKRKSSSVSQGGQKTLHHQKKKRCRSIAVTQKK